MTLSLNTLTLISLKDLLCLKLSHWPLLLLPLNMQHQSLLSLNYCPVHLTHCLHLVLEHGLKNTKCQSYWLLQVKPSIRTHSQSYSYWWRAILYYKLKRSNCYRLLKLFRLLCINIVFDWKLGFEIYNFFCNELSTNCNTWQTFLQNHSL